MKHENSFRMSLVAAMKKQFGNEVHIQKNHGNQFSAGLADIEVGFQKKVCFIELKATPHVAFDWRQLTRLQALTLRNWANTGQPAFVVVYFVEERLIAKVWWDVAERLMRERQLTSWEFLEEQGCLVYTRGELFDFQGRLREFLEAKV